VGDASRSQIALEASGPLVQSGPIAYVLETREATTTTKVESARILTIVYTLETLDRVSSYKRDLQGLWLCVTLNVHLPSARQYKPTQAADSARLKLLLYDVGIHMKDDPATPPRIQAWRKYINPGVVQSTRVNKRHSATGLIKTWERHTLQHVAAGTTDSHAAISEILHDSSASIGCTAHHSLSRSFATDLDASSKSNTKHERCN
jgi:hypothetical protein